MKIFNFGKTNGRSGGFTLVETLVATSIFTVSILGLLSILSDGIADTNYAKQKIIASYLAQEGIEYARNMRDTYVLYTSVPGNNWNNFKAKFASCNPPPGNGCGFDNVFPHDVFTCNSSNCKLYLNNGSYSPNPGGTDSGFVRKVWMEAVGTPPSPDEVKIYSTVSWNQGSGGHGVTFSENLFNWIE